MPSYGQENKGFEYEMDETRRKSLGEPDLVNSVVHVGKNQVDNNANNAKLDSSPLDQDLEENEDEDIRCGIGCFSPEWVQQFGTKKCFLLVFTLLGVIQGMTWSYFTGTISTLEKRFKISSQTAGIVMTGNEISQIIFSIFLSYYGGKGHRPRWISVGVLCSSMACFVLASPHFFYGSGDDALRLTEEYSYLYDTSSSGSEFSNRQNGSSFFGAKKGKVTLCERSGISKGESCDDEIMSIVPLVLIFLSQFVAGIGVLLFFTLGGPYLDDNTRRTNIPIVFGVTMSLRLIGPTIGFLIASRALKLYVNPLLTPLISPEDPRWIGAWWLGWVIFGSAMVVSSFFIALFPRRLKRKNAKSITDSETIETIPKLTEIPKAVKALLQNKVNLCNNLAGVFYLFSAIGYWTYMPKYLETIFMQTASNASVISGVVGIFSQATGMLLSGFLISRFQFSARKLAAWNIFTAFLYVAVKISFTQMGCDVGKISFGTQKDDGTWNLTSSCNSDCNCKTSKILPVCYKEENTVFYSACHAGCTVYGNNTIRNCSCIPNQDATVTLGNCAEGCTNIFILFLAISAFIKFVDATGRIGNMLISYRCVNLEERSLSIGLNMLLLSALAFLPSPILFGRIIDNVCLVWGGAACGKRGNCMLYNGQQLRYIFNLTAATFTFIGGCLDCLVYYLVKDIDLYSEPGAEIKDEKSQIEDNNKEPNTIGVN